VARDERTPVEPTPFDLATEREEGIAIVAVNGELDLSTAPELERAVDDALDGDEASLVLDMAGCRFIDSTGIALLVRVWQRLGGGNGEDRFAICCVDDQVRRLLDITGLDTSMHIHASRDEALSSLGR
jgi:anti-sigma B factor antagonist